MNKRKGTYKGNFDFSDLIREAMGEHYAGKVNNSQDLDASDAMKDPIWKTWTTPNGSNQDRHNIWADDYVKATEFVKTGQPSEPAKKTWWTGSVNNNQMNVEMVNVEVKPGLHPLDSLQAPKGWDNYVKTGALKWCMRPMPGSGCKKLNLFNYFHITGIETINFEMI